MHARRKEDGADSLFPSLLRLLREKRSKGKSKHSKRCMARSREDFCRPKDPRNRLLPSLPCLRACSALPLSLKAGLLDWQDNLCLYFYWLNCIILKLTYFREDPKKLLIDPQDHARQHELKKQPCNKIRPERRKKKKKKEGRNPQRSENGRHLEGARPPRRDRQFQQP